MLLFKGYIKFNIDLVGSMVCIYESGNQAIWTTREN